MRDDRLALISASRGTISARVATVPTTTTIVIHIWVFPFFFANVRFAAWLSVASRAAESNANKFPRRAIATRLSLLLSA